MSEAADLDLRNRFDKFGRAVAFGFFLILCMVSFFNICANIVLVPEFKQIFRDMLGGKALPAVTAFVIDNHMSFVALSVALPLAGLMVWRLVLPERAITGIAGLMAAAFVQVAITWYAIVAPLVSTIQTMSSGGGGTYRAIASKY